ncbi:MAG: 50S ribosomal protein L23 [Kiritimatiellae bacterium]|nr:50S ribosomal protein L23 [Kiritimatiellia bacterium]
MKTIIKKLLVTEKGTRLKEANQYLFEVDRDANKIEIKDAVEKQFKVKVLGVRTMTRQGKAKRLRTAAYGRTADRKRAVVTLEAGQSIDLA